MYIQGLLNASKVNPYEGLGMDSTLVKENGKDQPLEKVYTDIARFYSVVKKDDASSFSPIREAINTKRPLDAKLNQCMP